MGKFDGILLCTDFDGTLAIKEQVSQENCDAIRYFQENGGKFTILSGRHPFFLKEHLEGFTVNAPLVGYNGAYIIPCAALVLAVFYFLSKNAKMQTFLKGEDIE